MDYIVNDTELTATADAIREKTGDTALLEWITGKGFADVISGIESGGGGGDIGTLIDKSITEVSSDVTSIGEYAFRSCSKLATANFPVATSIRTYAFYSCSALTTADFPVAKSIAEYAFHSCSALTAINFPVATSIAGYAFHSCSALTTADFPVAKSIAGYAFYSCSALTALMLRRTETICTLSNTNAFTRSTIASGTGYIYVPTALIDSYKAASNWSTYAAQFRALEDYTIDGTTTGDLDPNKI